MRHDAVGVGGAAAGIEGKHRHLAALLLEEAVEEGIGLFDRQADAAARGAMADIGHLMPAGSGMQRHAGHLGAIGVVQEHRPGHFGIVPLGGARHREEAVDVELEQAGRRGGEVLLGTLAAGRYGEALFEGQRAIGVLVEEEKMLAPWAAGRLADIDEGVEIGRERRRHLLRQAGGDQARLLRAKRGIGRDGLRRQRRSGDGVGRQRFRRDGARDAARQGRVAAWRDHKSEARGSRRFRLRRDLPDVRRSVPIGETNRAGRREHQQRSRSGKVSQAGHATILYWPTTRAISCAKVRLDCQ